MPIENNMMFTRPRNCHYCIHGYHGLYHMVQYAQSKGFNTIDISGDQANKPQVDDALIQYDPLSFYGFGHGHNCRFTGDLEEDIFNCTDCDKLSGRVVYLLSCLTGNGLGQEIIRQGALAYAGFNISWTWTYTPNPDGSETYPDPYDDPYALGFYESANELWKALCDGKTFHEAVEQSRAKYDEWIDYWIYDNPTDPGSASCISWLAHDRDGLVELNVCDVLTSESECLSHGCIWENGACHSWATNGGGFNPLLLTIPIIALVGLVLIAGRTDTTSDYG